MKRAKDNKPSTSDPRKIDQDRTRPSSKKSVSVLEKKATTVAQTKEELQKKLRLKSNEYESLKLDYEILKRENEELHIKTQLLDDVSENYKIKTAEYDKLKMEFDDLTRRHTSLNEEAEALRVSTDYLKKQTEQYGIITRVINILTCRRT